MDLPDSPLPVPIGNEMELQIVNGKGEILRGEELIDVWDAIFGKVESVFKQSLESAPESIKKRIGTIKRVTKEKSGKQLPYLEIEYKTFKTFHISAIGPDPNISQVTWLMELVTPPATTMAEFAWWNVFLNTVLLRSLPPGYWLLPIGLSPTEKEYASGVTFGEHYHIGVDDPGLKHAIYTLLRNFVPHLIALTTNSPFINRRPTGTVKVTGDGGGLQILTKDCTKSLRLFYNKAQMGPVDKETYIPCLKELDKEAFCEAVHRKPPDDRFVDIYPFTPYGTIEIRVCDTQFALSRRIAIVALLEALCLKAKGLLEKGERIPCVLSSVLVANREKAAIFGLHGKFTPDTTLPGSFGMTYNEDPVTGKQNGKLFQAMKSMLFFLKKEIAVLGLKDALLPVRLSIEGNSRVKAPVNPADYLLYLAGEQGGSVDAILPSLKRLQTSYCTGKDINLGDPIVDEFGPPHDELKLTTLPTTESQANPTSEPDDVEFTNVAVVATEPQIKDVGPIPFQLSFTVESGALSSNVDILLIQQLIEIQKKSEIVLATSFKRMPVPANKPTNLSHRDFPLVPAQDLFFGNKQCRLKFVLKQRKEATVYSNAFWIELLPRFGIASEFRKRKLFPGDRAEVKYKISTAGNGGQRPAVDLGFRYQVVSADGSTVLHQEEKRIPVRDAESFAFNVVPQAAWKEREISLRLTTLLNGKIIARHEIAGISIDIPEERGETLTTRLAGKKAETLPPQKGETPGPTALSPGKATEGLVKHLEFSTGAGVPATPAAARAVAVPTRSAVEAKPVPGGALPRQQVPPSQKVARPSEQPRALQTGQPTARKQTPAAPAMKPPEARVGQERMATLLAPEAPKKARDGAAALNIPFLENISAASSKVDIASKLLSPRLVAPGEKIIVAYTMKRAGIIGENEVLKLVAFTVNSRRDFIVVSNEKVKLQGESSTYTLTIDPARHLKDWIPTDPFHVVLQAYKDNTLVGQSVYGDFELAKFTTSSQITWRKVDLLSGTIYPGMDAGFDVELGVRTIVNPVAMTIEASCQGTVVTADFVVAKEGTSHSLAPFRVPFQGLTTVPNAPMIIKIKDSSGMTIKEQKKIVTIIAKGPMFVIKDVILDTMEGLDNATLAFELFNDNKLPVSCQVTVLAMEIGGAGHELVSRKLKLKGTEMQHQEYQSLRVPINAISENAVLLDFLIEIPDFNKIRNLIRHVVRVDPSPGEKLDVYFHGKLKNLERTSEITAYVDKVGVEIEVRKDITLGGCKARLVEMVDGETRKVIHTVKLPKGRDRVHETISWKPPKAKAFPLLCKLGVEFVQDDELITTSRMHIEPLFFTIFPE